MTDTETARVELLPCPFCGGDGLAIGFVRATEDFAFWSVECRGCGVEVADDASETAAVAHWNTRPPTYADGITEGLRMAAECAEGERRSDDTDDRDFHYNLAIEDILNAIRALNPTTPGGSIIRSTR